MHNLTIMIFKIVQVACDVFIRDLIPVAPCSWAQVWVSKLSLHFRVCAFHYGGVGSAAREQVGVRDVFKFKLSLNSHSHRQPRKPAVSSQTMLCRQHWQLTCQLNLILRLSLSAPSAPVLTPWRQIPAPTSATYVSLHTGPRFLLPSWCSQLCFASAFNVKPRTTHYLP